MQPEAPPTLSEPETTKDQPETTIATTTKKLSGAQQRQLRKRRSPLAPQYPVKRGRVKADGSNA